MIFELFRCTITHSPHIDDRAAFEARLEGQWHEPILAPVIATSREQQLAIVSGNALQTLEESLCVCTLPSETPHQVPEGKCQTAEYGRG
jgi:hypothetical protein